MATHSWFGRDAVARTPGHSKSGEAVHAGRTAHLHHLVEAMVVDAMGLEPTNLSTASRRGDSAR